MIDIDKWQEIFISIKKQKLRTALTAFGVFWGIFMLVILLGFGTGMGNRVEQEFGDAKNAVFIWSSNATQMAYQGMGKGRRISLHQGDVDALRQQIKNIDIIDGKNEAGMKTVLYEKESASFQIAGTHANWEGLESLRITDGRFINLFDEKERRKVAVINEKAKKILFKNGDDPIGKSITISGVQFYIIGIYKQTNNNNMGSDGGSIYLPNDTLRQAFNLTANFTYIIFKPIKNYSAIELEKEVKKQLHERHKIHPDDSGVLGSFNMEFFFQQSQGLITGIVGFSWMVAIGTIIAGVIGVGNIMLVIVKERTREIGLRKSLGATPFAISVMILQESLLITLIAGYSGLVAGVCLLEGITAAFRALGQSDNPFATPFIDIYTAMLAMLVLVICGVLAAVLPAMKAAAVNPIVALQDE